MAINYQDLLRVPTDQIERPKPKPAGTYSGIIKEYKFDQSKKQRTPYCRIVIAAVQPGDDILADPDLAAQLAGQDLSKWNPHRDFYLTADAMYRLKDLVESLGVDTSGRELGECLPEIKAKSVVFEVTLRPSEDGETFFNDVGAIKGA